MTDRAVRGDGQLLVAIARGDSSALAEVYLRHAAVLHGLASQWCGAGCADDVVEEVFLLLWRRPEIFANRGLRRSLALHTHGCCVELLHQNQRKSEPSERGDGGAPDIRSFLAELPVEERDAVTLASLGGLSYQEIARDLDQAEHVVKASIRHGLHRLRAALRGGPPRSASSGAELEKPDATRGRDSEPAPG